MAGTPKGDNLDDKINASGSYNPALTTKVWAEDWNDVAATVNQMYSGTFTSGINVTGNVSATSIGGIIEANLLDKTVSAIITNSWLFDTDTGNDKFYITRLGASDQSIAMWVDDEDAFFVHSQDETVNSATQIIYDIETQSGNESTHKHLFNINGTTILSINAVGLSASSPIVEITGTINQIGTYFNIESNQTDSTAKRGRITTGHYTNTEEDFIGFYMEAGSANNEVFIGGGDGGRNTATIIYFYTAANNTTLGGSERMKIDSAGDVTGTHGNYHISSDERLKINDKPLPSMLNKLMMMNPISFYWNDLTKLDQTEKNYGFKAQELEKIDKNLIKLPNLNKDKKWYSVNERYFDAILVKSIQELNDKVIKLEEKEKHHIDIVHDLIERIEKLETLNNHQ